MRTCKKCGKEYSWWTLNGWGDFCSECGPIQYAETERLAADPTIAEKHLLVLLDSLAPGQDWPLRGIGLWTTLGHKASQTADLWIGRALLGVGGDVLHAETQLLGVFGLSASGRLHFAKIGECKQVTGAIINAATLDKKSAVSSPIAGLSISQGQDGKFNIGNLPNGQEISVVFPPCFLVSWCEQS